MTHTAHRCEEIALAHTLLSFYIYTGGASLCPIISRARGPLSGCNCPRNIVWQARKKRYPATIWRRPKRRNTRAGNKRRERRVKGGRGMVDDPRYEMHTHTYTGKREREREEAGEETARQTASHWNLFVSWRALARFPLVSPPPHAPAMTTTTTSWRDVYPATTKTTVVVIYT